MCVVVVEKEEENMMSKKEKQSAGLRVSSRARGSSVRVGRTGQHHSGDSAFGCGGTDSGTMLHSFIHIRVRCSL